MCPDNKTPWSGTSCVEMPVASSCGSPCPPRMRFSTHSKTGQVPKATCFGKCFTCSSQIFKTARAALGFKDGDANKEKGEKGGSSVLKKCEGNQYIIRTDGWDLPNFIQPTSATSCIGGTKAASHVAKYVCVNDSMHYRLYPGCKAEGDQYLDCKIIDGTGEASNGKGQGLFEPEEVTTNFRVKGVDYDKLQDDTRDALRKIFQNLIAAGVKLDPAHVDVILSKGSVVADATVKVPKGTPGGANSVANSAAGISPASIVNAVKTVPNMGKATPGGLNSISVAKVTSTIKQSDDSSASTCNGWWIILAICCLGAVSHAI